MREEYDLSDGERGKFSARSISKIRLSMTTKRWMRCFMTSC